MTLATHAVVGAAISSLIPEHPILGFCLGFGSHFVLDAIPHWDYHLRSSKQDEANRMNDDLKIGRDFYLDLLKIGFDALLGLVIGYLLFHEWWGALGAMLPDFLQFVYFKTRWRAVGWLQRFHLWIHTSHRIKNRPLLGITLQALFVLAVFLVVKMLE